MIEDIKKMPKIELHLHLDGSVSLKIASKLSNKPIKDLEETMIVKKNCASLSEYLTKFNFPKSLMQTRESLYEIARDLTNYLEEENIVYAEVRFAPIFSTKEGLSLEDVVDSVLKGLNSNKNIKTNLILCMMRGESYENNLKIISLAEKYLNKGVCAIDLAGAEDKYPLKLYEDLFKEAKKKNIPFTIHAGENTSYKEVKKAISLGAKRIGHGIFSIQDEETLKLLKEKDILLEICPTSNVNTNVIKKYEDHPIYKLYQKNIPISINTDNKTVSNVTLNDEYEKLSKTFNFTYQDFKKINEIALKHSFLSEQEKEEILKKLF